MQFDQVCRTLGLCFGAYLLLQAVQILLTIYAFFFRGAKNFKKYGEWAIVTGATDGIGKAYAFELAKKGLNVLLISRTEAKLVEVEEEIKKKYPKVTVSHLAIDYSNFDTKGRDAVKDKIASLDVGVLINNVGVSYPFAKYFHELTDAEIAGLVELNVNSTVWMTRIVLGTVETDGMIKRKRGAIVNTSSAAGRGVMPLLAEYSGAKSFIEMFSQGLKAELASFNIHVQVQAPLYVATKLAKIRKTSLTVPSPAAYARAAVAHIGYEDTVSPYWSHALQLWLMRRLPNFVSIAVVDKMHRAVRKAGIKKQFAQATEGKQQ